VYLHDVEHENLLQCNANGTVPAGMQTESGAQNGNGDGQHNVRKRKHGGTDDNNGLTPDQNAHIEMLQETQKSICTNITKVTNLVTNLAKSESNNTFATAADATPQTGMKLLEQFSRVKSEKAEFKNNSDADPNPVLRKFFDNLMGGTIEQMELFNNKYRRVHETPGSKMGNNPASSTGNSSVDRSVTADTTESLPRTRSKKVSMTSTVASTLRNDDSSHSSSDSDAVEYLKTKPSSKKTSASSTDDSDDVDESDGDKE